MERKTLDYFRDLVDSMAEEDLMVLLKELAANLMYQDYVEKQEEPNIRRTSTWESVMREAGLPDDQVSVYIRDAIFYCYDYNQLDLNSAYEYVSKRYGVPIKHLKKEIENTLTKVYRAKRKRMGTREVTNFEVTHFGHEGVDWSKPEVFILDIARRMRVWV